MENHPGRFAGKVGLFTGAGSGIGRATAEMFARQGGKAVVADIDAASVTESVQSIRGFGGNALGQVLDVTSESGWNEAIAELERTGAGIQTLVNCAGIAHVAALDELAMADWRRVMAVNLDGVFLGMRAAIRSMRKTGGGAIVNVASASGIKAAAASSAYCASKAAMVMLTKVAALECARAAPVIRINAVAPGGVRTAMWSKTAGVAGIVGSDEWNAPADSPLGKRFADPEEVAAAILFLASAEASYITGSVLTVDAGYTV